MSRLQHATTMEKGIININSRHYKLTAVSITQRMKCCEKKTVILLAKKWKLTNLVERQVKDPFAITCPNGKN